MLGHQETFGGEGELLRIFGNAGPIVIGLHPLAVGTVLRKVLHRRKDERIVLQVDETLVEDHGVDERMAGPQPLRGQGVGIDRADQPEGAVRRNARKRVGGIDKRLGTTRGALAGEEKTNQADEQNKLFHRSGI